MKNIDEDGHYYHLPTTADMTSISTQPRYSQGDGHRAAVHDDGAKDPRLQLSAKGGWQRLILKIMPASHDP